MTSGEIHTCGIKTDGTAWCWGYGGSGQLGNGVNTELHTPVAVTGGGTWTALTAGGAHTCGVKTGGTAWCWGSDDNGQLGNGVDTASQKAPIAVSGGGTWTALTAAYRHTCGTKTDGTAWCWGQGNYGQLGNGSPPTQTAPVAVADTTP